jgi:uncharacterized phage protein gp47/JayE
MSCTGQADCLCGCCAGTSVRTPQRIQNAPGLPAVGYRVGTWASFKESLLARLSSADFPALAGLKTRADDDFSIAFLDAAAVMLDILTFYQERLANESYLHTAGQLRSLTELSRLIGYQPAPGVAASAYLAFTLQATPGQAPSPTTSAITITKGTQVQSVPAQGQQPQYFETSADAAAKADWNALAIQTGVPWAPPGGNVLYLSGTTTQLQQGDSLLILGVDREEWDPSSSTPSEQWDVVVLDTVQPDPVRNLTRVTWSSRLYHGTGDGTSGDPATWTSARVFAFRQKAGLFGNNAPSPYLFVNPNDTTKTNLPNLIDTSSGVWQWYGYQIAASDQIALDAPYPKITVGSWFALTLYGLAQLYKVTRASVISLSEFSLSGKATNLVADFADPDIGDFDLALTQVWAQSDDLSVAPQPLDYPLYGTLLDLQDLRPDLSAASVVALSGKRQKLVVASGVTGLSFVPDDGSANLTLNPGDTVTLTSPTPLPTGTNGTISSWSADGAPRTLSVEDASGRPGTVDAALSDFTLAIAGKSDPLVSEYALVKAVLSLTEPYPHTQIQLTAALLHCYDRTATTVNANVVLATNGQTVSDILGSGNAAPNQEFTLRQSPLTYVSAPTASGRQSTLQVRVNGVAWTEVPSLYQQGPAQPVFATSNQSDGTTDVQFGDGVEGATLPTGQSNVQATYRIGLGTGGNVAAGAISTLVDRPLGVSGVTNPADATGGQDAEATDAIRSNAPQTVQTLGRAVSLADYQSYAATFAGIAKAQATWIPNGPGRGVFLTVAGVNGAALPSGSPTLTNLVASLHGHGNPLVPIIVQSFLETLFRLSADVAYDPAYDQPTVQANLLQTLYQTYSFAARDFGQGVSADEVAALIQSVPGVTAVNVKTLKVVATSAAGDLASPAGSFTVARLNRWLAQQVFLPRPSDSPNQICAYLPIASARTVPQPAEILVLDPDPKSIVLGRLA